MVFDGSVWGRQLPFLVLTGGRTTFLPAVHTEEQRFTSSPGWESRRGLPEVTVVGMAKQ